MATPWLGAVTPFTLNDPTQFRMPPPPSLSSECSTDSSGPPDPLPPSDDLDWAPLCFPCDFLLPLSPPPAHPASDNFLALWERILRGKVGLRLRAVKGQDERPPCSGAPLTAPHVTTGGLCRWKAINKDGRHVGLDFYDLLIEGDYAH